MSLPASNITQRIIDIQQKQRSFAYALLSPQLQISESSPNLQIWLSDLSQEPIGLSVTDAFWEFAGMEESLQTILDGTESNYTLEYVARAESNGQTQYCTFRIMPANPNQPQDGLLLIVEDSTIAGTLQQTLVQERNELRLTKAQLTQANQELDELNKLKSLFLSMAAHDLRSPLSAIQGYADLLRYEITDNTDHATYLQTISSQAAWLGRLINNLLDLDRLNQGKLVLDRAPCNLNDIINASVELNQLSAQFQRNGDNE